MSKEKQLRLRPIREIDENFVKILEKRIEKNGYNVSKPILTCNDNGNLLIIDGNHRYKACKNLGMDDADIPVVVKEDVDDPIVEALQSNWDEETSRPMTFLDYAYLCHRLHEDGLTYEQIGEKLGWSYQNVLYYNNIVDKLSNEVLNIIKNDISTRFSKNVDNNDGGCVENISTNVDFWKAGWFRDITPLNPENQLFVVNEIIEKNGKLKGQSLKKLCQRLKLHEEMKEYVDENLVNDDVKESLYDDIKNGVYNDFSQIEARVDQLNQEAQKILLNGDAVELLREQVEDNYIDCVITDPPYGIKYVSNRKKFDYEDLNKTILNDELEDTLTLLEETIHILDDKTKDDSHLYIFCSWKTYPVIKPIIETKFTIKNVIVWIKNNHTMGDLDGNYAEQYELIIFATKGNKKLRGDRPQNVLEYDKVSSNKRQHPTEKPVELLKFLIEKSTGEGEVICDPFMGAGSTIVACGDRNPYIGIELDEKYFKIAQRRAQHGK